MIPALIGGIASAAEQLRSGGTAAQQIAVKVTMKAPAGGPG